MPTIRVGDSPGSGILRLTMATSHVRKFGFLTSSTRRQPPKSPNLSISFFSTQIDHRI
jgi:hypothetical protein